MPPTVAICCRGTERRQVKGERDEHRVISTINEVRL